MVYADLFVSILCYIDCTLDYLTRGKLNNNLINQTSKDLEVLPK